MAVLAIFTGPMTRSQYDTLRFMVDWARTQPPGAVFHAASFDDAGQMHVADVWESVESLNAFLSERLIPALETQKLQPPQVAIYPAHMIQAYSTVDKYRI